MTFSIGFNTTPNFFGSLSLTNGTHEVTSYPDCILEILASTLEYLEYPVNNTYNTGPSYPPSRASLFELCDVGGYRPC